jgi:hypothetical protein
MSSTPNWTAWLDSVWGPSFECAGFGSIVAGASNLVFGSNPPYTVQDFLAIYPKYGGPTLTPAPTGTATANSKTLTAVSSTANIAVGNPIADSAGLFPDGTFVTAIGTGTLTLSNAASGSGATTITVWNAPPLPFAVIQAYIALASSCLIQARWLEQWPIAMSLFVAHFLTLYAQTDGNPNSTASQIASQGIATGVQVAKSVGDISVSYQALQGIEDWAAWNLTKYGQMLATMARVVGAGPLFLY